jgi:hypothetical protein
MAWNALEVHYVGGCADVMTALAGGQERSLAQVAEFLDHADAVLAQVFRAQLRAYLPALQDDSESVEGVGLVGLSAAEVARSTRSLRAEARCGDAYTSLVERYATCGASAASCAFAPRIMLTTGALRIAMLEPPVELSTTCTEALENDLRADFRELARESARVISARLDPEWTALADRLATLSDVYGALAEICVPRRRRFTAVTLDELQVRLARLGGSLAAPPERRVVGAWATRDASIPVPGLGVVRELARYERAENSLARSIVDQANAAREYAFGQEVCRSRREQLPLAVALIDVERGALEFFGFFYPEELFCEGVPPLRASSSGA